MKSSKFWISIKKSMIISPQQIALIGIIIALGMITDAYLRIGHLTFLTTTIYIFLGIYFPLWLGLVGATLIDTFSLLLRGTIGYWYWSLQIEPLIIVFFTFIFKSIFQKYMNAKLIFIITIFFILLIVITSVIVIQDQIDNFKFKKILNNGKIETNKEMVFRIIQYYVSIMGLLFIIYILFLEIYKFKKTMNNKITVAIFIIAISIIIDWIYHPWATTIWMSYKILSTEFQLQLFKTYYFIGVIKSFFHIIISIPVISILLVAFKNTKEYQYNKIYFN